MNTELSCPETSIDGLKTCATVCVYVCVFTINELIQFHKFYERDCKIFIFNLRIKRFSSIQGNKDKYINM